MIEDPLLGRRLANYRLERVIGRGGMAQVYYGWDIKLDRPVAVKVVDARYRTNPAYAERFVREARALATWRHEHITQIYFADDQDGLYYYAMEFVDGQDLSQLLEQYQAQGDMMPEADILRIGRAVAAALDYAHGRSIVHRDVKPSNVLLDVGGRVLLSDFGLAMDVSQGSLGEVFGSPHYMAPEQARHSAAAVPQSDLYSLGVMLYELLTGRLPFDDPAPAALALRHITDPPPPPRAINPLLNEATEAVLLRALHKLPQERYPSGAALIQAFDEALGPLSENAESAVTGPDGSVVFPAGRFTRRTTVAERLAQRPGSLPPARPGRRGRTPPGPLIWLPWGIGLLLIAGVSLLAYTLLPGRPDRSEPVASRPAVPAAAARPTAGDNPLPQPEAFLATRPPPNVAETATPSREPSPTATATATASVTATEERPVVVVSPTILYPDGHLVRLIYHNRGFYLLNLGDRVIDVRRLGFEALNAEGVPTRYRFYGQAWAEFYPFVQRQHCNALELFGGTPTPPAGCNHFSATMAALQRNNQAVFWLSHGTETQFRVLWEEGEIGRCQIDTQRCDVYLPPG